MGTVLSSGQHDILRSYGYYKVAGLARPFSREYPGIIENGWAQNMSFELHIIISRCSCRVVECWAKPSNDLFHTISNAAFSSGSTSLLGEQL